MSLKTDCHLTKEDWEFVMKLARIAHVHVLTSQVSIRFEKSRSIESDKKDPLIFPKNWSLQYVNIVERKYEDHNEVSMTFEVLQYPN